MDFKVIDSLEKIHRVKCPRWEEIESIVPDFISFEEIDEDIESHDLSKYYDKSCGTFPILSKEEMKDFPLTGWSIDGISRPESKEFITDSGVVLIIDYYHDGSICGISKEV